jgi:hypothetical protein
MTSHAVPDACRGSEDGHEPPQRGHLQYAVGSPVFRGPGPRTPFAGPGVGLPPRRGKGQKNVVHWV